MKEINLDQKIEIVEAENIFAEYEHKLKELINKANKLIDNIAMNLADKAYLNKNTGNELFLTKRDLRHALDNVFVRRLGGSEHIVAVSKIPALIEMSVLVETHQDNKNREEIKEINRYYAALKIDNPLSKKSDIFVIKLTGLVYINGGIEIEFNKIERLHDLRIEKKLPAFKSGDNPLLAAPADFKSAEENPTYYRFGRLGGRRLCYPIYSKISKIITAKLLSNPQRLSTGKTLSSLYLNS